MDGLAAETIVLKRKAKGPFVEIRKRKLHVPLEVRKKDSAHQPVRGTRKSCALCCTKTKQVKTE